jgi:23S rRNA pseudouridine1911/1915/1917 synthase
MIAPSISDLIIYNNNQLIAVNKPSGISSQKDPTEGKSIQELVEIYCKHPVQIVHRLDRPASGRITVCKKQESSIPHA